MNVQGSHDSNNIAFIKFAKRVGVAIPGRMPGPMEGFSHFSNNQPGMFGVNLRGAIAVGAMKMMLASPGQIVHRGI